MFERQFVFVQKGAVGQSGADLLNTAERSLALLGGRVERFNDGFVLQGGNANIQFSFAFDISASVSVRPSDPGTYEVVCQLLMSPNGVFWVGVFGGFCTVFLWGIPVLYFIADPLSAYQRQLRSALPGGIAPTAGPPTLF